MTSFFQKAFIAFFLCAFVPDAHASDINMPETPSKSTDVQENTPEQEDVPLMEGRPKIHILGKEVITLSKEKRKEEVRQLPEILQTDRARTALANRRKIRPYQHNPTMGPSSAPITIVEMLDLSCLQCMDDIKKLEKLREKFAEEIRIIHVHLPVDLYNASNPAAFYGKLAQRLGVFWEYRQELVNLDEIKDDVYIEKLLASGADFKKLRYLIRNNARQFYRELDADALLAQKAGEIRPPAIFINGIKIGANITFEEAEDLIRFEIHQYKKKKGLLDG